MVAKFFMRGHARPRELTGRTVLVCLVGFFVVVGAVNAVMIAAAISTFAGLESDSPYQAGLAFDQEIAAARLSRRCIGKCRRRWPGDGGETPSETARDADGALPGLSAPAPRASDRPAPDRDLAMSQDGRTLRDRTAAGQWDVVLSCRAMARQFRSRTVPLR